MRIAIVGGGVAGLVSAHLLHPLHEVTVFEARAQVGGHSHTAQVVTESGQWSVDTGFVVYNRVNYPRFTALLAELGVQTQPSTMSFSVRMSDPEFEYNGSTTRQLFAQRRNLVRPWFYRMLADILRFNRRAVADTAAAPPDLTLGALAEAGGYSRAFIDRYLVPMGAAIWSAPPAKTLEMPARFFVQFFRNHGMLTVDDRPEWRVVTGGAQAYVDRLTGPFRDRIRTERPVREVGRGPEGVLVDGEPYDHVVFACHSDQALRILADATSVEREVLSALPFQENDVVLHTDTSLMPRRRRAWGAWNYHAHSDPEAPVSVTYNMNQLQSLDADRTFLVTLNDTASIDPELIIDRFAYAHPLYAPESEAARRRHGEISGVDRTHFCGAYWGDGFHEAGVESAYRVCAGLGVGAPAT